ncbi:cell wall-binding repeat-containing protein [Quadrisphaera sp. DSM 44207]|uniref:cell wall-binding repeat-containing protein n=1 Tax=Quadrisphaera sp. DSM 44207 TaxID=1881057 RepID=UPI00088E1C68|nr:cell wall-binding repeat-containing protein [Quadrisphaera sp. DSM 44207]SDQ10486.1 Putative cell wall binding repeat 2 [Quadrisphaera sp. DSM 44207]
MTTVVYAPHPDDEVLRLCALVPAARRRGDRLVLVAVTDGEASGLGPARGMTPEQVAAVRTGEQDAAWAALAGPGAVVVRLRMPDGGVRAASLVGLALVLDARCGPGTTHSAACHASDSHRDHVAVATGLAASGVAVLTGARPAPEVLDGSGVLVLQADPGAARRADEAYAPFGHASVPTEFAALRAAGHASRVTEDRAGAPPEPLPSQPGPAARPVAAPAQPRIAGRDRWETAALLARAVAAERTGRVRHVLLANGDAERAGVDALSASYLAGALDAPVLLTAAAQLPASTLASARELFGPAPVGGATLHVIGGPPAVPAAQLRALEEALPGVAVVRIGGADRYETARAVALAGARLRGAATGPDARFARTVLLASGTSPADALVAGQVAFAADLPVLLTTAAALPGATAAALRQLGASHVVVLGGPAVVSDAVLAALGADGYGVRRVAGADRYETAAALLAWASAPASRSSAALGGAGLDLGSAPAGYLVSGASLVDAVAAAPLAGRSRRPLLPTPPGELHPASGRWLGASRVASVTGIGSPGVLAEELLVAVDAVLGVSPQT